MPCSDMGSSRLIVVLMIVEEDIGAKGVEEFAFFDTANKEQSFIDANVPGA